MQVRQGARSASVVELREDRVRAIVREEVREALKLIEFRLTALETKADALLRHFKVQVP